MNSSDGRKNEAIAPAVRIPPRDPHTDILWEHLKRVPAFRALLRSTEARFYQHIDLPKPILDLGCGDGIFAELTFEQPLEVGFDPWWGPLREAFDSNAYEYVIQGIGSHMPFPDDYFGCVISNSVLEHIDDVHPVLHEVNRVLKPGGKLVVTMPTQYFTELLGGAQLIERFGSSRLADRYRHLFNRISRHKHTDSPEQWAVRFSKAGLALEQWQYYFSKKALHALEIGHVQGLPSALCHYLTGHWIIAPWKSNLRHVESWIRPYYEENLPSEGTMALYIARKVSTAPIEAVFPQSVPVDLSYEPSGIEDDYGELTMGTISEEFEEQSINLPAGGDTEPRGSREGQFESEGAQILSPLLLFILAIVSAFLGQLFLRGAEISPILALGCFIFALICLYGLGTKSGLNGLTRFGAINFSRLSRRRWFVLLAFFLSLVAYNLANVSSPIQRPFLALLSWIGAIVAGFYGLWLPNPKIGSRWNAIRMSRWELLSVIGIFLGAFLIRTVDLMSHPFVLSGSEASIGMDAQAVINGQIRSPFATGWLTNPTLPLYFLSIPLRFFGTSILAVRILSPLLGALGVALTYLVGRWMFGSFIGLVAAILLAGSHFHLHYSRIGLTNIWDPFFVLLSLGLLYLAWLRSDRHIWLLAGLSIGLGAYLYTSSHLLPLILLGFLILMLIKQSEFKPQYDHFAAAMTVALIVALPQILHYYNHSAEFWDRFLSQGILQTSWIIERTTISSDSLWQVFVEQFARGMLAFHVGIDNSINYVAGRPMLGLWTSALLFIGIGLAIVQFRQVRFSLLIIWYVIILIFASALLIDPPMSHRLLVASPAVYLFIAVALGWFIQSLITYLKINQRFLLPSLIFIALLLSVFDIGFYFGPFRAERRFGDRNTEIAHEISEYINSLEGEWTIYFYGAPSMYSSFPTFAYLIEDWQSRVEMVDVIEMNAIPERTSNRSSAHIFIPERANELSNLQQQLPGGQVSLFDGHFADPLFFSYSLKQN